MEEEEGQEGEEEEEVEHERPRKRLPRGSSCLICKQGKRKCDGQRPTCGRCRRVGCTCVYSHDGSMRPATAGGMDRPTRARKKACPPRRDSSIVQASVRAPSERSVEASPPQELARAASLVRPPSEWVVGSALAMAQVTGSIIEAIVRMSTADVLDIAKARAYFKGIGPTIKRALGNDVVRHVRGLVERAVRRVDSADAATSEVEPQTQKRIKSAAGLAHVLLSLEDQDSMWFRLISGLKGSLEVTVSEAMAKLFVTSEELATMIKASQLAPVYSWTRFIEPDSIATAVDALCRAIGERGSNNTRYVMIQCQTRQGLSVRCHASIAWSWGVGQAASVLVVRLKPMVRLLQLSPDYHYITPHTLIAAAEPCSPVCGPSGSPG